jgi:hypothetical protein
MGDNAEFSVLLLEIIALTDNRSLEGLVLCEDSDRSTYHRAGYFWLHHANSDRNGVQSHYKRFAFETLTIV